jgi:hypothetical protein
MCELKPAVELKFPDYDDDIDALELVFQVCNGGDPQSDVIWYDHGLRSLSVGDVVVLMTDDYQDQRTYTCDASGWTRLAGAPLHIFPVGPVYPQEAAMTMTEGQPC